MPETAKPPSNPAEPNPAEPVPAEPKPADPDRDRLTFPKRVLLWSIRIWVVAYHQQRSPMPVLERAFRFLGAEKGAELANRTMAALGAAGRRQIDIRPPCYTDLSDDEWRILRMVRLAQHADHGDFRFDLLSMVRPERRQPAESLIRELADALLAAGLDLAAEGDAAPAGPPPPRPVTVGRCPVPASQCREPH